MGAKETSRHTKNEKPQRPKTAGIHPEDQI